MAADTAPRRLQMLREMVPDLQRVGVVYNPENVAGQSSLAENLARERDTEPAVAEGRSSRQ
jgi:ABC-type uncharacterized transport system substrate-binding protein